MSSKAAMEKVLGRRGRIPRAEGKECSCRSADGLRHGFGDPRRRAFRITYVGARRLRELSKRTPFVRSRSS